MEQVWTSQEHCTLKGVPFRYANSGWDELRTTAEAVVVLKPKGFFEQYQRLPLKPERILEIGVFEGGSALLMADMYPDAKIVGVDLREPNPAVLAHVQAMGYGDRVKLYYETSQDDRAALERILEAEFGGAAVDFVIDDASHIYGYSGRCLEILWPQLRVGGCYAIEDWGWAHWPGFTAHEALSAEAQPLSSLVLELAIAAAAHPSAIREVQISAALALVWKRGELPPREQWARVHPPYEWRGFVRTPPADA